MASETATILAASLSRLAPVSSRAVAALAGKTSERRFAEGAWLLRGGERAEWCFLVVRGLVRELYVDADGAEHTRTFLGEGQVTGSLVDLLSGEPAITWIQALEPTTTLAWRYDHFDVLCKEYADLANVARRSAEALAMRKTRREHELLTLSAAARHARWLEGNAALDARVSRKLLASYLGITPEHLSRLRRAFAIRSPSSLALPDNQEQGTRNQEPGTVRRRSAGSRSGDRDHGARNGRPRPRPR